MKLLYILLSTSLLCAQVHLQAPLAEYYSSVQLLGLVEAPSLNFSTLSNNQWSIADSVTHPWEAWEATLLTPLWERGDLALHLVSPQWFNSFNLNTPSGMNDGGLWQGRGYNSSLIAGARFKSTYFEATFAPELYFSENKPFATAQASNWNGSEYGYYTPGIDLPQRFGNQPYFDYGLGQSEVRLTINAFTLGAGTQNVWLGPTHHQALIWSNNAQGFPKVDIGMNKKATAIGDIETRFWWGALQSSSYYNGGNSKEGTPDTYLDFLAGFSFSYAPKFIPGLTLGANRTSQTRLDKVTFYNFIAPLDPGFGDENKFGDTAEYNDGRFSLTWDWTFPLVGFNFYGEYAREDFTTNFLEAAEHTRGLAIGVRQLFDLTGTKRHLLAAEVEIASLVWSRDYLINDLGWGGGYYRHHKTNLGYTHRGQGIGAGMGTGANSQYYGVTYFSGFGSAGIFLQRLGHDDSPLYKDGQDSLSIRNRPVGLEIGAKSTLLLPHHLAVSASLSYLEERNWKFDADADIKGFRGTVQISYNR